MSAGVTRTKVLTILAVPLVAGAALLAFRADSPASPTYHADVLPILQSRCQDCHRENGLDLGGMVAPQSFTSYEETREWGPLMVFQLEAGRMPPWHASGDFLGHFSNERYISETEVATIRDWVVAGSPEGDPAEAPDARIFESERSGGWAIGEPDLIVRFPEPYLVLDEVEDEYVDIEVEIPAELLPEDRWVKAVEFHPGSPTVHHIIARPIGGIAPGYEHREYPDGYSRLLRKGTTVTFQMHYHKEAGPGSAEEIMTEAGIKFYEPGAEIRHVMESESLGLWRFEIPAGAPNYCYDRDFTFERDVQILRFNPHMHLRGKSAYYEARLPDGTVRPLLDVPAYDFQWQHDYWLRDPLEVPAGTDIYFRACWDNSADNPSNPDATRAVRWGRPTTDEMGFGFMGFTESEPRSIIVGDPIPDDLPAARPLFSPGDR
ncbi:MAG: hypothetical protein OEU54_03240 [Gemmatimonadota bacterium]|nr:hypothetical protein [Gemmatimonadota bacterium]